MRARSLCLLMLLSLSGPLLGQSAVDSLRSRLAAEEEKLADPVGRLHDTYRASLHRLQEATPADRHPHRAALLREEIEGFAHGRIAPAKGFRELERLQEIYDNEYSRSAEQRSRDLRSLLQRFRVAFRELEAKARREGDGLAIEAARKAVDELTLRLERVQTRIDGAGRNPLTRRSTRSRPIVEVAAGGATPTRIEWSGPLDINWELGGPSPGLTDNWTLELNGSLRVPATGTYTFSGGADDEMTVTMGGRTLGKITNLMKRGSVLASVDLEVGWQPFTITFREGVSHASMLLQWNGPGFETRTIEHFDLAGPPENDAD